MFHQFLMVRSNSGWWFGTWISWLSIQLGISLSQLTNSHISEGLAATTNQMPLKFPLNAIKPPLKIPLNHPQNPIEPPFLSHGINDITSESLAKNKVWELVALGGGSAHAGPCDLGMMGRPTSMGEYPLVICYITMERSTIFHGKFHYKWWFSTVTLNYQRVCMGVSIVMGVAQNRWFISWKIRIRWK